MVGASCAVPRAVSNRASPLSPRHWHEYCNISYSNMVGYRSPNYYNNPAIRKALSEEGYLYDATLVERWYPNSPTSPAEDQILWPYTMDGGIPQVGAGRAGQG